MTTKVHRTQTSEGDNNDLLSLRTSSSNSSHSTSAWLENGFHKYHRTTEVHVIELGNDRGRGYIVTVGLRDEIDHDSVFV